jgi:hypothetical protein
LPTEIIECFWLVPDQARNIVEICFDRDRLNFAHCVLWELLGECVFECCQSFKEKLALLLTDGGGLVFRVAFLVAYVDDAWVLDVLTGHLLPEMRD